MSQNRIHFLIKLGKKRHIEELRNQGIIFMNPLNFFKEMEDDEQRKDIHEGVERIEQITWLKIAWEGKEFEFSRYSEGNTLSNAQLRVADPELNGNIFSMIAITTNLSKKTDKLDERNMEFGDSFLVIFNPKEFLNRIVREVNRLKMTHYWDLVTYYDEKTHNGDLGIFFKPKQYEHQNEFRIFVENNEKSPIILKIGSIEDISEIFEINEFKILKFREEYMKIEQGV